MTRQGEIGQGDGKHDHPDVAIRPPRLFLMGLVCGFLIDQFLAPWSGVEIAPAWRLWGGLLGCGVGLAMAVPAIRAFLRAGTNVPTVQSSTALVTTGLHGVSRNPIYIGMIILYLGLAMALGSPTAIGAVVPVVLVLHFLVVKREEIYLTAKFGDAYRDYVASVPRWLGLLGG